MAISKGAAPNKAAAAKPGAAKPTGKAQPGQPAGGNVISLRPSDQQQGGLLDDVDVTFTDVNFVEYDYGGSISTPVLALHATLLDGEGKANEQYWSAGDLSRFQPSEDGLSIVAVGASKGLNNNTNAAALLRSVVDAGFPEDKFGDGSVDVLEGLVAHVNRVAQPKRAGIQTGADKKFDPTVLVVTKVVKLPWEKGSPKGAATPKTAGTAGKTAASTAAASPSEGDSDLTTEAAETLVLVLGENNGSIPKAKLAGKLFKPLMKNANRGELLKLLTDDEFLANGAEYGWEYDGETITAA